ncbi:hypothetical protein [Leptospira wolffii]|uniref:hypothetical protein n=1 Tax=Leptospira wolffii TaxID=409998 RepID=UPI0002DCEE6A|nr:hypothetical protein [Leptospira wolffii]EPG67446.1 hypothetical protein LEP1GSC061_0640 [Leptospira wolffii serovar Khorat str. Khorat-H2]
MKSNQWPKVIGILGILLGTIGTCSSEYLLLLPKTTETQRAMFQNMAPVSGATSDKENFSGLVDQFDEMTKMEPWFEKWCYIAGTIGILISLFYIFASIWLILLKQTAVWYFYLASAVDILFSLIKGIVGFFGPSITGISSILQSLAGMGFVALLLIITAVSDKAIFREEAKPS